MAFAADDHQLLNLPGVHLHASQFRPPMSRRSHQWRGRPVGCEFQQMGGLRDGHWSRPQWQHQRRTPDTTFINYLFGPRITPTLLRQSLPISIYCSGGMHAGTSIAVNAIQCRRAATQPIYLPGSTTPVPTKHTGKPEGSGLLRPGFAMATGGGSTSRSTSIQLPADWPGLHDEPASERSGLQDRNRITSAIRRDSLTFGVNRKFGRQAGHQARGVQPFFLRLDQLPLFSFHPPWDAPARTSFSNTVFSRSRYIRVLRADIQVTRRLESDPVKLCANALNDHLALHRTKTLSFSVSMEF